MDVWKSHDVDVGHYCLNWIHTGGALLGLDSQTDLEDSAADIDHSPPRAIPGSLGVGCSR